MTRIVCTLLMYMIYSKTIKLSVPCRSVQRRSPRCSHRPSATDTGVEGSLKKKQLAENFGKYWAFLDFSSKVINNLMKTPPLIMTCTFKWCRNYCYEKTKRRKGYFCASAWEIHFCKSGGPTNGGLCGLQWSWKRPLSAPVLKPNLGLACRWI